MKPEEHWRSLCRGRFHVFFSRCMALCSLWTSTPLKRCVWKNCTEVMCKTLEPLWHERRRCSWDSWPRTCYICSLIWLLWVDLLWFDPIGWNWENSDVNKHNFTYFVPFWRSARRLEKMKLTEGATLRALPFAKKGKMQCLKTVVHIF